jgi:drug/metabolite transporter (DMT)-like permease
VSLPVGECAALGAALIWAVTSIVFTRAGRLVSPVAANTYKAVAATVFLTIALWVFHGRPVVSGIAAGDLLALVASGLVGIALGDSMLFHSWQLIGTRRGMLVMALSPVIGALGGILFLGDEIGALAALGMALALGGVMWVIGEGRAAPSADEAGRRSVLLGALLGLGAAASNAGGAVLARHALARVGVLEATQLRVAAAAAGLVALALVRGSLPGWLAQLRRHRLFPAMTGASFLGPCCGIFLLSLSLDRAVTGVALTLASTSPIWLLPLGARFQGDHVTARELIGALVALGGVAVLLLPS